MPVKTPQQIAQEKDLAAFLKVAKTRSGVPHKVSTLQRDGRGFIQMLKGTVTAPDQGTVPMYWAPDGQAFASNNTKDFDLVQELSLDDLFAELGGDEQPQ